MDRRVRGGAGDRRAAGRRRCGSGSAPGSRATGVGVGVVRALGPCGGGRDPSRRRSTSVGDAVAILERDAAIAEEDEAAARSASAEAPGPPGPPRPTRRRRPCSARCGSITARSCGEHRPEVVGDELHVGEPRRDVGVERGAAARGSAARARRGRTTRVLRRSSGGASAARRAARARIGAGPRSVAEQRMQEMADLDALGAQILADRVDDEGTVRHDASRGCVAASSHPVLGEGRGEGADARDGPRGGEEREGVARRARRPRRRRARSRTLRRPCEERVGERAIIRPRPRPGTARGARATMRARRGRLGERRRVHGVTSADDVRGPASHPPSPSAAPSAGASSAMHHDLEPACSRGRPHARGRSSRSGPTARRASRGDAPRTIAVGGPSPRTYDDHGEPDERVVARRARPGRDPHASVDTSAGSACGRRASPAPWRRAARARARSRPRRRGAP